MGTTSKGLPYPEPTDPVAAGADNIKALAEAIDPKLGGAATWSFRARRTEAGHSIPGSGRGTVICDTKDWDPANGYSTATGIYTAPVAGIWLVTAAVGLQLNSNPSAIQLEVWLVGGGSPYATLFNETIRNPIAGEGLGIVGSTLCQIGAGQGVYVAVFNGGGNPAPVRNDYQNTHFAMARIG